VSARAPHPPVVGVGAAELQAEGATQPAGGLRERAPGAFFVLGAELPREQSLNAGPGALNDSASRSATLGD